jgi:hypothetical protein
MSRIVVFGNDHRAQGELTADFDRGWMLTGHPSVTGGGSTALTLSDAAAIKPFLQFGRMVLVKHATLPSWAGMIDPPWDASLPVSVAVYNAEYLLSLRAPEAPVFIEGSVGYIVSRMVEMFNAPDDLFVRVGDISQADPTPREETLDGRNYWEQLKALLERSGCEMLVRADKDAEGHLVTYLDISRRIGIDTGFLYSDGQNGNAVFSNVSLDGPIINRVVGTGSESGPQSRLRTAPMIDVESGSLYRVRSEVVQWRDVLEQSTLDRYTNIYVDNYASPKLTFTMNILDKGDAFLNARLGNSALVHISNAYLPGGVQGWKGQARILAMAYTESQNALSAIAEAL